MKKLLAAALLAAFTAKTVIAGTPGWILQVAYLDPEDKLVKVITLGGEDTPMIFQTEKACKVMMGLQKKKLDSFADVPAYVQRCHQIDTDDYQHESTPLERQDLKNQA